jgi:hypothetical protein
MITRRLLIPGAATGLLAAAPPSPDDPVAIINAIYARVARGNGDGGGTFVIENKAARARYLSRSLADLWAKADARTRRGMPGRSISIP